MQPLVTSFFDEATFTFSYVIQDPQSKSCAIIDCVLDFDYASGKTDTRSALAILAFINTQQLEVQWILETHVHADHLSAAPFLREKTGGRIGIGAQVTQVQRTFSKVFNSDEDMQSLTGQFDYLFEDGEEITIGHLKGIAMHTPGHTPACMTYVFSDAAFVGDTLFMPDYGTARCDFPGGDAAQLYQSIQKIFTLDDQTRLFLCHDYKAPGRSDFVNQSSVAMQRANNIHIGAGVSEADFVKMRNARDQELNMPKLIIPAVQVNIRAGNMPPAADNGQVYLKIPINMF
ncbi:MAG: MBL fold metallo-hydrolase [Oceanospirillaceae bacterium]|nr:MBL fold metallo-hydrolase [Oceanospirillaceae bacterium]